MLLPHFEPGAVAWACVERAVVFLAWVWNLDGGVAKVPGVEGG